MKRILLVLEDVTVPGDQPLKLRVTTIADKSEDEVFLASTGIEAISPSESEPQHLNVLRFDISRSLKQFLARETAPKELDIRIQPVDGRNKPLAEVKWSTGRVRLELTKE